MLLFLFGSLLVERRSRRRLLLQTKVRFPLYVHVCFSTYSPKRSLISLRDLRFLWKVEKTPQSSLTFEWCAVMKTLYFGRINCRSIHYFEILNQEVHSLFWDFTARGFIIHPQKQSVWPCTHATRERHIFSSKDTRINSEKCENYLLCELLHRAWAGRYKRNH